MGGEHPGREQPDRRAVCARSSPGPGSRSRSPTWPTSLAAADIGIALEAGLPEWVAPIVAVIPGQVAALRLGELRGVDVDRPHGLRQGDADDDDRARSFVVAGRAHRGRGCSRREPWRGARAERVRARQPARVSRSAPKRAYLMSSVPETGATFTVSGDPPAARRCSAARSAARSGAGARASRTCMRWTSTRCSRPAAYAVDVAGPAGRHRRRSRSTRRRGCTPAPLHNTLSFYEDERDGPDFIRSPLRTAPGHLNDEHARTYLTPKVDGNGAFKGDLTALPELHRRRRRLVGRRRLPEVRADDELRGRR